MNLNTCSCNLSQLSQLNALSQHYHTNITHKKTLTCEKHNSHKINTQFSQLKFSHNVLTQFAYSSRNILKKSSQLKFSQYSHKLLTKFSYVKLSHNSQNHLTFQILTKLSQNAYNILASQILTQFSKHSHVILTNVSHETHMRLTTDSQLTYVTYETLMRLT